MTRRRHARRSGGHRGRLSWPAAALPPLLLVGVLVGGSAAELAPSSGRVVDIVVTSGH